MTIKYDHDALAHTLAKHLVSENRMVWEDIPAGMAGSVRPDVYTIEKSYSKPNPISYEIKVSVSDFRSDITKGKWQQYLDFSYGVVFAVPKGLVTKEDIPKGCGLMTFNGEFWNTVRKPTISPKTLNSELLLKLLIEGNQRQTFTGAELDLTFPKVDAWKKLRKKFGDDVSHKMSIAEKYKDNIKQLETRYRELADVLGVTLYRDDVFNYSGSLDMYSLDRAIKDLKVLSDDSARRQKVVDDLDKLKDSLTRDIERLSNRLKSDEY